MKIADLGLSIADWGRRGVLFSLTGLLAYSLTVLSAAAAITAEWDVSPQPEVIGYKVLMGAVSQSYTSTNIVRGRLTSNLALTNVPVGVSYVAVVAFADDGAMSPWSNEVAITNHLVAPKNFRLITTITTSASTNGPWRSLATVALEPVQRQYFRTEMLLEEAK